MTQPKSGCLHEDYLALFERDPQSVIAVMGTVFFSCSVNADAQPNQNPSNVNVRIFGAMLREVRQTGVSGILAFVRIVRAA